MATRTGTVSGPRAERRGYWQAQVDAHRRSRQSQAAFRGFLTIRRRRPFCQQWQLVPKPSQSSRSNRRGSPLRVDVRQLITSDVASANMQGQRTIQTRPSMTFCSTMTTVNRAAADKRLRSHAEPTGMLQSFLAARRIFIHESGGNKHLLGNAIRDSAHSRL